MRVTEGRAAYILFNILKSSSAQGRWIIPSNCCSVIPATFFKSETPFEVCDISTDNFCLDLNAVSEKINQQPSAYAGVLFIYTYGAEVNFNDSIVLFKERHPSILFVEDKCLCKPDVETGFNGVSDAILYSTGYAKYTDMGAGGYAYIVDSVPYERQWLTYQKSDKDELDQKIIDVIKKQQKLASEVFLSNWLSSEHNCMADAEYFTELELATKNTQALKSKINQIYKAALPEECCMPDEFNQWRYNIIVNEPQKLIDAIFDAGLFASRHYKPIDYYITMPAQPSRISEWLYQHVVNMFNDKYASSSYAEKMCSIVKKHQARFGCPEKILPTVRN